MPPGRRKKACDLCCTKKIKCDSREPRCSNCILYKTDCRHSTNRHRADPSDPILRSSPSVAVQERSHQMIGSPQVVPEQSTPGVAEDTNKVNDHAASPSRVSVNNGPSQRDDDGSWTFDPLRPTLYYGPRDEHLRLLPLDDVIPIIDHYFNAVNPLAPVFSRPSTMKAIIRWFNSSAKRETLSGAAILMATCLGLQSLSSNNPLRLKHSTRRDWISYSLRNAQSLIPELMARDEDLLGLQMLVALALSFRQSRDLGPASFLLGMAVRSAHRMQLHSTQPTKNFAAEDVRQRSNVFWVIYMLDQDLSLRLKVPPLLSGTDIDIPFPQETLNESPVLSIEDNPPTIFRYRLELARLEGKVYNLLYSAHSMKVDVSERRRRIALLQELHDQWHARLPATFRVNQVLPVMGQTELLQLAKLHHASLLCLLCIHGIWSGHAEWTQRLDSLSKAAISDIAEVLQAPKVATCIETQLPPLWDGWNHCVTASRWCMKLLQCLEPTDSLVWHNFCPHFTAIIVLFSNVLIQPVQIFHLEDVQLAATSRAIYNQLTQNSQSPVTDAMRQITKDLHAKAVAAITEAQLGQTTAFELISPGVEVDGQSYTYADNLPDQSPRSLWPGVYEDIISSIYREEASDRNGNVT